jgi:hypothetical protein
MSEKQKKKKPQDEVLFTREGENYFTDEGVPITPVAGSAAGEGISVNVKDRAQHLVNALGILATVRRNTGMGQAVEVPGRRQAIEDQYAKRAVSPKVVQGKIVPSALGRRKELLQEAEEEFRQAVGHIDPEDFEEFWISFRAHFAGGRKEARARDAYRKKLQKLIES